MYQKLASILTLNVAYQLDCLTSIDQALRAGNREQGTGNSKKKPARILGLEQVNLFMKKIKTFFSRRAAQEKIRPCTNPLILIMGISLLPVARSLFPFNGRIPPSCLEQRFNT
jgi:hypothetical protein